MAFGKEVTFSFAGTIDEIANGSLLLASYLL